MEQRVLRKRLLAWYEKCRRSLPWRDTTDPWAIWVSEVMLQQTRVAAAVPYYLRFMKRFPTPRHLADADLQMVLKGWEGLGYYSRARNLHRAACQVVSRFHGEVPRDPEDFRSLPGVGDYISAAVMSIAFGHAIAVVDGNVKRVLSRLLEMGVPVNAANAHKLFQVPAQDLLCPDHPAAFNQAVMELGALVCHPKRPECEICPLSDLCLSYRHQTTTDYPKRKAKGKVPHRHQSIAVIEKNGKMLVVQRPDNGLLAGLWEFPAFDAIDGRTDMKDFQKIVASETGLTTTVERVLKRIRHAYTHFTLTCDVYLCRYAKGRVRLKNIKGHRWTTLRGVRRLPLHKVNHKFMDALEMIFDSNTSFR